MNLETTFAQIIESKPYKKAKSSSLIQPWLGVTELSQSLSIKIGNYLEELFNCLLGDLNIISQLPQKGKQYICTYEGEDHQVDLLARVNNVIYHRELKCNTDLDRGKKRDVRRREESIFNALHELYPKWTISSCVFCPFLDTSQEISGLGRVEGLADFIDTFSLNFTVEDFKALGKSEQIHKLLLLK